MVTIKGESYIISDEGLEKRNTINAWMSYLKTRIKPEKGLNQKTTHRRINRSF